MIKLYSTSNKKILQIVNKSEAELNNFLSHNWKTFFPQYVFIKSEFSIEGNVRSKGTSGRIDILAFNPNSKKFVVFELKKEKDKNIRNQVSDYKDFIEDNFSQIYLMSLQKYNAPLPLFEDISQDTIEVVMIAKSYSSTDIERVKKSKSKNLTTLIRYLWFENELLLIDYINNDPDDLIEKENAEKLRKIKNIIENNKSVYSDVESFLFGKEEAQRLFKIFYEALNKIEKPELIVQASKIKIKLKNQTFSVIGYAGKTGRKCYLVINTNIDEVLTLGNIVDDRIRPNKKKKGSIGSERYEVFLTREEELIKFISIIENNI
ncbi:MAG: hypothetical protein CMC05_00385 [Flavobacteriaceae bacterium]|nr:hypothetical protein [Flavobacteriaceae bacterium]MBD09168.1 hypothetical protein [Flavobacteriaceae bacterium]|tara:strand:- start:11470 stop:12429 length:960 start_codon:yes stop_codon:yes gene_type:complete